MTARKRKAGPRQAAKPAQNKPAQDEAAKDKRTRASDGEAKTSEAKTGGAKTPALIAYWPRLLFAIPLIAVLWVPFYNRTEPSLGGVPFFYWYQLALVLVGAALVLVVYLIETRITRVTPRASASVDPGATGDVL